MKHQPQDIVAVMGVIEPVGDIFLRIGKIGKRRLFWQRLVPRPFADLVDTAIAPDKDQPCGRIARRPLVRPCANCPEAGFLKRLFRRVEITEIA